MKTNAFDKFALSGTQGYLCLETMPETNDKGVKYTQRIAGTVAIGSLVVVPGLGGIVFGIIVGAGYLVQRM
jgi:hypothetical protein